MIMKLPTRTNYQEPIKKLHIEQYLIAIAYTCNNEMCFVLISYQNSFAPPKN